MIIFGSKSKVLDGPAVDGIACPACGQSALVTFGLMKYFHVFWIPMFPTSRKPGAQCRHCKKTLVGKELPAPLASQITSNVFTPRNTVPMFTGLVLFAVVVLAVGISVEQEDSATDRYIESPATGDLYVVDFTKVFEQAEGEYKYGVMRVNRVGASGVELAVSAHAYNGSAGPRKAIREGEASKQEYFDGEPVFIEMDLLRELREKRAILTATRE